MRPLTVIDQVAKAQPETTCYDLSDARDLLARYGSTPTPDDGFLIPPLPFSVWGYRCRGLLDVQQLASFEPLGITPAQFAFMIFKIRPGSVIVDSYFTTVEAPHDLGRIAAPMEISGPKLEINAAVAENALPSYQKIVVDFLKPVIAAIYLVQAGVAELRALPFKDATRRERQLRRLTAVPDAYHYLREVRKKSKTQ